MKKVEKKKSADTATLFERWNGTLICPACRCIWIRREPLPSPASAQIIVGDFCFFAGTPNIDLVKNFPAELSL